MTNREPQEPFNLFIYGTLMNPSVFRAVLGRRLVLRPAGTTGVPSPRDVPSVNGSTGVPPVNGTTDVPSPRDVPSVNSPDDELAPDEVVYACEAVLNGYKKVSPDSTYLYAVPAAQGRIRGYLVGPLPAECMAGLREYEGRNYSRRTFLIKGSVKSAVRASSRTPAVYVSNRKHWDDSGRGTGHPAGEPEKAVVFVGNLKKLQHSFGYAFRDPFKQEVLLLQKIDRALLETEREQVHRRQDDVGADRQDIARRAVGELHGPTIRDLIRRHFDAGGISDYAIRHSLKDAPLRDFDRVRTDDEARALAPNYLSIVIRQVLFNQIEDKIRRDFRYELDHIFPPRRHSGHKLPQGQYYERTVSSLAALRMINSHISDDGQTNPLLDLLTADALTDLKFPGDRLVDFVQWAVVAADALYESRVARGEINYIKAHVGRGHVPLGAELEFSNIGHGVISDPKGRALRDAWYDGFLYFSDFGLDTLTWKLGGHVDDHHEKCSTKPRRGFFEVALGSLSLEANLSKPITNDPWLLNQFIHGARRFYPINPHSVHLSLQLRTRHRPSRDRLPPPYVLKCLFAIAGDPCSDASGELKIERLVTDEIVTRGDDPQMLFSDISRRHSRDLDEFHPERTAEESGRYVQQFKFLRLGPHINYEPLIVGLKGIQLSLAPGSFLTGAQTRDSHKHRELFDHIIAWGENPQPIPQHEMEAFLGHAYDGLMSEHRGKPAHSEAYIAWALGQLRDALRHFNDLASGRIILGRRDT